MRCFFENLWWRWRAWRIRCYYRKLAMLLDAVPAPDMAPESYEGTGLWRRPYDLHIDLANFRNLLPLLREKREEPNLTVEDLVHEAIMGAVRGEAKRRGLHFAGRFEEGNEVIVQWRTPEEAMRLVAEGASNPPPRTRGHERRNEIV